MRRTLLLLPLVLLAVSPAIAGCEANQTHPDEHAAYDAGAGAPLSCVPNLDGRIDASELQPVLGLSVKYLVSPAGTSRPVNLAGMTDAQGHLVWDWGTDYADDQVANIQGTALKDQWYASSFPNGQFVVPFDAGDTVEQILSQDAGGLYLQGLASTKMNPPDGQTLFVYDKPILLYPLPLMPGAQWSTTGSIKNGMLKGLPWTAQDTYDGTDVATGQMVLPDLTFTQAHRIRYTVTTKASVGQNTSLRQDLFLFECFGEIARATSQPNEANDDFTTAAEIRRFGL